MSLAMPTSPARRSRLLLVEDEPALAHALSRYLEKRGLEVAQAGSIAEARRELDGTCFDAMILDVGLPDGDGLSLLTDSPEDRTLVITANPDPERFARSGVRHFLAKPFDLVTAARLVSRILGSETPATTSRRAGEPAARERLASPCAPLRVAFYSHDAMGLGHFRRNVAIAEALTRPPLSATVLLLVGAREANAFPLPPGVECLCLPALYKESDGAYRSRSLDLPLDHLVALRAGSIQAALRSFAPHALIVDKAPWGALGELAPALEEIARTGRTRCILGLRDVLDDPATVSAEWERADNETAVRRFYDRIWVYGDPHLYDPVREYAPIARVAGRVSYTGLLARPAPSAPDGVQGSAAELLALCVVGGGQDGAALARAFARARAPRGMRRVLVTGPYMPESDVRELELEQARQGTLEIVRFDARAERWMTRAHCIVSMGGYNSVCEGLAAGRPLLIVPRVRPRVEQLIRAQRLAARGLADAWHPDDLDPERLSRWITTAATHRRCSALGLDMGGLARIPRLLAEALASGPGIRSSSHADVEVSS